MSTPQRGGSTRPPGPDPRQSDPPTGENKHGCGDNLANGSPHENGDGSGVKPGQSGGDNSTNSGNKHRGGGGDTRLDRDEARRYLAVLSDDPDNEVFTFAAFDDDRARKWPPKTENGRFSDYAGYLETRNQQGYDVFVAVNKTDGKGRKGCNIKEIRAVWCDWDHADKPLPHWPVQPHVVVATSPGKYQAVWVTESLSNADPPMPEGVTNRAEDNWRPLVAVADLAGGAWPTDARDAAKAAESGETDRWALMLLEDIRAYFAVRDALREACKDKKGEGYDALVKTATYASSAELITYLTTLEARPWLTIMRGKPVNDIKLAMMLRPFGIRTRDALVNGKGLKRWHKVDLLDSFDRYLTEEEPEPASDAGRSDYDTPF